MQEIAAAVREGAQAYLKRQYTTIAMVGIVIFLLLAYFLGTLVAVGFLIGAVLSGAAGFIGMNVSVRANVRTAQAATTSLAGGLELAFKAGAITGMLVAGLALLGVTLYFAYLTHLLGLAPNSRTVVDAMVALGFGASLISIFARLGGGIFTKGADVGGDLVGKVEAGIPEDDPRNPATIADNVGDNVGDCAGMAADLFETYAVTAVATMVLAAIFFAKSPLLTNMMTLPLAIGGICIITSIIGTFFVKLGASQSIMGALYKGLIATGILSLAGVAAVIYWLIGFGKLDGVDYTGMALFECGVVGLVVTGLIIWITEYYTGTDYRPVKSIAAVLGHRSRHQRDPGPRHFDGSDRAAGARHHRRHPRHLQPGRPVRHRDRDHDHAGAGRHGRGARRLRPGNRQCRRHRRNGRPAKEVRKSTDALDAVGNTTKAVTKGYAIGSAGLGALVLFAAYNQDLKFFIADATNHPYFPGVDPDFSLNNPYVVVGLLFGGLLPYLFGAMGMTAVGRAASAIVEEVRRQFREKPGIMQGTDKPDYGKAVDL